MPLKARVNLKSNRPIKSKLIFKKNKRNRKFRNWNPKSSQNNNWLQKPKFKPKLTNFKIKNFLKWYLKNSFKLKKILKTFKSIKHKSSLSKLPKIMTPRQGYFKTKINWIRSFKTLSVIKKFKINKVLKILNLIHIPMKLKMKTKKRTQQLCQEKR